AYLFISHDLRVVRALAHRIIVMRQGRVVEEGPAERILRHPRERYTRELVEAAFALEPVANGVVS
ncbi:MAG: microcin ABC transporter ATP-binding protein, partial [Acetobacteraceae bacterium]|nr:microcin ABC transporter ATP-binding protein [Acetobacteraceae bacterium]